MFTHVMVGANDIDASKAFYDATMAALGGEPAREHRGRYFYHHKGSRLAITKPINGEAATPGNGMTISILGDSPEQVDAWHEAGLAAGGTPCEDPPGIRQASLGAVYMAYLRDPAGNKLCVMHRLPA
ncbi:MAG: glyoxalase [Proteobacteria bacterium SG_bin6]|nr:MAG: glyoxalase [Proteobacteria bacterium SG_bin6]